MVSLALILKCMRIMCATGGFFLMIAPHAVADPPAEDDFSPRAKKVIKVLNSLALDDPHVYALVDYVDDNLKDDYFAFAERQVQGGLLKVGYNLEDGFHPGTPEIRFTPKDSNISYAASREGALASYRLKF